ncbi:MAG: hypothetical protein QOH42_1712 [Blastocatellia bacterium]|nr:hypothetical protein [Blastocatellia bacterium]
MKEFAIAVFLLTAATVCLAQSSKPSTKVRPDLSGTWILDGSRSNLGSDITDYVLTIVHREPEIRFSKRYKRGKREIKEESIYHTDGRPEFGPMQGSNDSQPETRWRDNKLVRKSVIGPRTGPVNFEFVVYEEWAISPDSQTLTRTVTSTGPSVVKSKAVFTRRP